MYMKNEFESQLSKIKGKQLRVSLLPNTFPYESQTKPQNVIKIIKL